MGSKERPFYFMWVGVSGVLSDVFAGLEVRVAKCHEYDGYIRVKIFKGWGLQKV